MNLTARRESASLKLKLQVAGVDPILVDLVVEKLVEGLVALLKSCHPDPTPEAVARLKRPAYGWFGIRQWRWENDIRAKVKETWQGPKELLVTVQDAVIQRLDDGVSPEVLAGLYGR